MLRSLAFWVQCGGSVLLLLGSTARAQSPEIAAAVAEIFVKGDQNSDKTLSQKEYEALRGTTPEVRRDFIVFDLNTDQTLSEAEFHSIPSVGGEKRGPIADPFAAIVEQLLEAIRKQAAEKEVPDEEVEFVTERFLIAFQKVINDRKSPAAMADPDEDSIVTWKEATRFFEIQIGIRRSDGKQLRFADGRLVNNNLFQHTDLNGNLFIDKQEFIERSYGGANVADEFTQTDTDLNDQLSLNEWCVGPARCMEDPVLDFLRFDTDIDGFVSEVELHKGVPEWKLPLARYMFPGFDGNKDGKFSLTEFRQIIPENMVAHWYNGVVDVDADEKISLEEFQFDRCSCSLLRRLYFSRLDIDGSGTLEQSEFPFRIKQHDVFFSMNADGTGWKKLYEFENHHACGSVTVSPDGKTLAFDSWAGDNQGGSALYTMDINGGKPKQVCMGMMPSWSADGKSLAFSHGSQGFSLWLTSIDGQDREGLANGWGIQLSPDGKRAAYTSGADIHAMELATGETTILLEGSNNPYQSIYWNSTWSPDGKRLCFKGVRADGTTEVASIQTTGGEPDLQFHHSGKVNVNADFAWHPNGDRIIFAMHCAERGYVQLYEFNPAKTELPTLVAGQDLARNNTDVCWTPDGQQMIIVSGDF